ncbi:hypothetical protein TEA_004212 [Camellia sinensis var. sinensis]|uniref:EF-hand domain-containing protein n=1 Tax=Camellia sinensis var. sinensis TaxID=542762 RepID=A0A4S4EBV5_CAMSN|nr:hypothetical protein TEA_004212 [Camellia sinensis var. sinensis]
MVKFLSWANDVGISLENMSFHRSIDFKPHMKLFSCTGLFNRRLKEEKRLKMEEHHSISMLEIARIYYETSTPSTNLKQLARDFFNSIDYDKDGEVSLCEFLNYMKEKGLINMGNRYVFNALDVNGNGSLDFMEVMALYYIIKSGRPFCGGCGNFIPGMFFSCSICFDNEDDTFSVCPMCFSNGNKSYIHQHKPIHFLDNFALLEAKRKVAMATRKAPPPKDHKKEWMWRVTLLESGLNMIGGAVGNAAGAIGGAMAMAGSCNIM